MIQIPTPKYKQGDKIKHAYSQELGILTIERLCFRIPENYIFGSWYYITDKDIAEGNEHGVREDLVVLIESDDNDINYEEINYCKNE